MSEIRSTMIPESRKIKKWKCLKKYVSPESVSMEAFALKTAVGVSPALKKEDNYIVSTLF